MQIIERRGIAGLPAELRQNIAFGSGLAGFFQSLEWFQALVTAGVFRDREVSVFFPESEAWALFARRGRGGRLYGLTCPYSSEFGPSGTPGPGEYDALCSKIAQAGVLEIRYLKPARPSAEQLIGALQRTGLNVDVFPLYGNWRLNVGDMSADEHFAARSSRLRNTVVRGWRKLQREHSMEAVFVDRECTRLPGLIVDFVSVYASSWKPKEAYPEFVSCLIKTCARLGTLRLGLLYADGQPIAAQFWIQDGAVAHVYKLAHHPSFHRCSPGSILTACMFRRALDTDRARVVDFGIGDEAYKRDWVDARQQIVGLEAFDPRTLRGGWLRIRRDLGKRINSLRRRAG